MVGQDPQLEYRTSFHIGHQDWVSLTVQEADDGMRSLSWEQRGCRFRDEHPLAVSRYYSQHNCLENCRLDAMVDACGCLPHHISVRRATNLSRFPQCRAAGLKCINKIKTELRRVYLVTPSALDIPGLLKLGPTRGRQCQCPPECDLLLYRSDFRLAYSMRHRPGMIEAIASAFSVRQRNLGATNILYLKSTRYSYSEIFAYLGNIAALFLGISILSVFELLVTMLACLKIVWKRAVHKVAPSGLRNRPPV